MKKTTKFITIILIAALTLTSCATVKALPENIPEDNVRNWYEIFVYSFADSDGDRIGDFRGATEKLDYVRDMGFTGIWLMPIMPSPSYHKYDVTDYCAIDPAYGTMEDFDAFLERAHELGIKVIIDLVVNHTSSDHPWFLDAKTGPDAKYRDYYNWSPTAKAGYNQIRGSYFESRFVSTMPDLNLDNPAVRDEIEEIMRFWLEKGVDGFRLDAVTSYYTGQLNKNVEFLSWLGNTARAIKPDCYIVGEAWSDPATINNYYSADIDSFFYFPMAGPNGGVSQILSEERVKKGYLYGKMIDAVEERFGDKLMAPFLGNHDMDRIANGIGLYDLRRMKAAFGMLSMMSGGTYVYYGDEIGMTGRGPDPNKRIGMYWSEDLTKITRVPFGTTEANYPLPPVSVQLEDGNSLLRYVESAMELRNALPAIARGRSVVVDQADPDICMIERTWNDETLTLVLNLSGADKTVPVDAEEILGYLDADTEKGKGASLKDGILTLEPWGIAVVD